MRKTANAVILLFVVCMLASCMSMHSRSVIVLNPDMSGKCTYELKMGKDMAGILTMPKGDGLSSYENYFKKAKNSQDPAMALASKLLSSGKIDAWKDVQFGYLKKDTVFFKGTAYFKDISKMAVSMFDSSMRVYKDASGNMVLEMSDLKKKPDTAITWKNHSYDSLLNDNIYKDLGLSDIMHYYMASMVKGLDISATYQLPGIIISSSNFARKGDNMVSISLTGNDVIKLLDTMTANNSLMGDVYNKYLSSLGGSQSYNSGSGMELDDSYTYYKLLYGEAKPVRVVFKGDGKPAFDYTKEVADAKLSYAKFRRASGIEKFDSLQLAAKKQEEEEKQKEEGTLVLTASDSANYKVYFKTLTASQLYGDDISFTGILSKPQQYSYDVKVKITRAVADNGANVKDSINSYNQYLRLDTNQLPLSITAYLTSSTYSYSSGIYGDSVPTNDKVTFSLYTNFPKDTKYINLEGELNINYDYGVTTVPFKIINLYIKPGSKSGLGKW